MNNTNLIAALLVALASPAAAGENYYPSPYPEVPAIIVHAPTPPPPPVVIGNAIGGLVTGAIGLPFAVLGAIFAPPPPSCYDPATGQLFSCAAVVREQPMPYGSTYAPPMPAYPEPGSYAPETVRKGYDRPDGCYSSDGSYSGQDNPDCRG
jgi:hypothetical protein